MKLLKNSDIAKALGVTRQTVHNWFSGKTPMRLTLRQVQTLCTTLNMSIEELLERYEKRK